MNIVLVQPDIIWESPHKNLEKYDSLLKDIGQDPHLILLPEMFTTGFSMNVENLAEAPDNYVLKWMQEKASEFSCAVTGSLIIKENAKYYNRLFFVKENGETLCYDKRHMFRMGGEGDHFEAGRERLIIHYKDWRICPLICYDLRFPVWSRNREDYDLLLYLANWPAARSLVWNTLLKARAIENQAWVIGLNRTGRDGESIDYIGESQVIDPKGLIRLKLEDTEKIAGLEISLEELQEFRKKFPVWEDRDSFKVDW